MTTGSVSEAIAKTRKNRFRVFAIALDADDVADELWKEFGQKRQESGDLGDTLGDTSYGRVQEASTWDVVTSNGQSSSKIGAQ